MALKMNVTDPITGVAITDAYIRVMTINSVGEVAMECVVGTYISQAARNAGKQPFRWERFTKSTFDHSSAESPKHQLYTYLKTLDEFSTAVDV